MGGQANTQPLGGTAIKPEGWDRTGMEAFLYFLFNPKTGEILSRTPLSWIKIIVFYIIYYSCLAFFWCLCFFIFLCTLPDINTGPKWKLDNGIIGSNPGVGLRPGQPDSYIDSQMFLLRGDGSDGHSYAERMKNYIEKTYNKTYNSNTNKYEDVHGNDMNENIRECHHNEERFDDRPCRFDLSTLEECQDYPHGFEITNRERYINPCVFLKLNKIWDWVPQPINPDFVDEYYEMTDQLKTIIKNAPDPNQVWFDCQGRFAADREALVDITYFPPSQGIPINSYFPYLGGDYEPPLVAVKIKNIPWGQLIHVECRAWYEGVVHFPRDKSGMVMFEVMVDW